MLLIKQRIRELIPNLKIAKKSWEKLDEQITNITKEIILSAQNITTDKQRKIMFPEDIEIGTKQYLESFNTNYLPSLKIALNDWIDKKIKEGELNASKRIYPTKN